MMSEVLESFCTHRAISFLKGALYLHRCSKTESQCMLTCARTVSPADICTELIFIAIPLFFD